MKSIIFGVNALIHKVAFQATICSDLLELHGGVKIYTLSKQMGNSAAMIERHYSKLTATMAADRLA